MDDPKMKDLSDDVVEEMFASEFQVRARLFCCCSARLPALANVLPHVLPRCCCHVCLGLLPPHPYMGSRFVSVAGVAVHDDPLGRRHGGGARARRRAGPLHAACRASTRLCSFGPVILRFASRPLFRLNSICASKLFFLPSVRRRRSRRRTGGSGCRWCCRSACTRTTPRSARLALISVVEHDACADTIPESCAYSASILATSAARLATGCLAIPLTSVAPYFLLR